MKPTDLAKSNSARSELLVAGLRREIKAWRRRHADLMADHLALQAQYKVMAGSDLSDAAPVVIEPTTSHIESEAVVLAVASDWHVYERVRPEEVNGLNAYNRSVAHKSIINFGRGVVRWTQIHRSGTTINTLMLDLLGDLMTNQIHEDQLETNSGTPQEEIIFLFEHIIGLIEFLKEHGRYKQIIVNCTDGNHGRDTEKLRSANRVKHSHEWLLCQLLAKWYAERGDKVVRFHVADGQHLYTHLFGHVIRHHHGDGIKYAGGVGGPTIPIRKAIAEWDKGIRADFDVFGHFHTRIMDAKFLCNGPLIGYSPYSIKIKAPFEQPSQSFVLLDKKRWIISDNRIYVR